VQWLYRDGPVMESSTGSCGKPGTGCDVMYQTAWSTSAACKRLWSVLITHTHTHTHHFPATISSIFITKNGKHTAQFMPCWSKDLRKWACYRRIVTQSSELCDNSKINKNILFPWYFQTLNSRKVVS